MPINLTYTHLLLKHKIGYLITSWLAPVLVLEETEVASRVKSYFRVDFYSQDSPQYLVGQLPGSSRFESSEDE